MTASGLLISGKLHQVEGLTIYAPSSEGGPSWAWLAPGDYTMRRTPWTRQLLVHATVGDDPMPILPGAGKPGRARHYTEMWQQDPTHAGGHIFVDTNGDIYCLCDLDRVATYHAEMSNQWSIGIEHCQTAKGEMYQATIDAGVRLCVALAGLKSLPLQMPLLAYHNAPLKRFETGTGPTRNQTGGPDCVGIFPHRANTERRGRGDPGDAFLQGLAKAGVRQLDYDAAADLALGKLRQLELNRLDAAKGYTWSPLVADGVLGPSSNMAMLRHFKTWEEVLA